MTMFVAKNLHETQGSQSKFHELNIYIPNIYINKCILGIYNENL